MVGIARNKRIEKMAQPLQEKAKHPLDEPLKTQEFFGELAYSAHGWSSSRRVLHKAAPLKKGAHPPFVITNLEADPKALYANQYGGRSDKQNSYPLKSGFESVYKKLILM